MGFSSNNVVLKFSGDAAYYAAKVDFNDSAKQQPPKPEPKAPRLLQNGEFIELNVHPLRDIELLAALNKYGLVSGEPRPPEGSRATVADLKKRDLIGLYVGPNPDDPKKAYAYLVARFAMTDRKMGGPPVIKWDGPK